MAKRLWLLYVLPLMLISPCGFSEESTAVTFTHYGHACFLITTSSQTRILTDPMKLEGYGIPDDVKPNVVTVSHRHIDHDNIAAIAGEPVVFYGINGPMDKGLELEHKFIPIDTQINDVHVYDIVSNHFNPERSPILNSVFVFEFDGIRVVHLGDLGYDLSEQQIAQIGDVDILMIPVGGKYTLSPVEADDIVSELRPKMVVLPMHFKADAAPFLIYTAEDFLKDKSNVRRISADTFRFDPGNPPQEVEFVLMNCSGE